MMDIQGDATIDAGVPLLLSLLERVDQGVAILCVEGTKSEEALKGVVKSSNAVARGNGILTGDVLQLQGLTNGSWSRISFTAPGGERYGDAILLGQGRVRALLIRHRWRTDSRETATTRYTFRDIIGPSQPVRDAIRLASRAARTDSSILITGESGTGKELFAQSIHAGGPRSSGPFVAVNCGAIPRDLIESELFGHEKGAFTGALVSRTGKFEQAHGGSIFLDEIGEMPLAMQVRLLRVLQEREVTRVGGLRSIPVDVRIIAATNRDLQALVASGGFREDLLYRIRVFSVRVPSLRERPGDILPLAESFLEKFAAQMELPLRGFGKKLSEAMMQYSWPGNVRELQNFVEAEANLCDSEEIHHIPDYLLFNGAGDASTAVQHSQSSIQGFHVADLAGMKVRNLTDQAFIRALEASAGSVAAAGKTIGVSRATAYRIARRIGVI
ncbi:MAG: sigma-54-dependent Fis family transcriptional regulator [Candidatus Wallbacteria bacterium HGW-Wallbacteria-1]|jgi:transcriptional regulator with PAS, ATPase and Fis domain|uniref:Sigma-54-dependent Fis family transcriptional regulator n=1 Tax=Candidatus Wallbacteria bacterium HGW-Wallbacteria-1 TaxID=2013854 RepID=A0A2N1PQC3_9BACT|nr:MAG: sigma-54-dependent Fis family transcriptional regulator [Candidatus Wallbacteria bacterium HGW-Wallbacteria-1]